MTRMKRRIFLSLLLIPMVAGILWAERREEMVKGPIRESVIAGSWYPGDPDVLRSQILDFLSRAKPPQIEGELIALISPHAGYMYSGQVAAYAYKLLEGRPFHTVVIVAPSHRAYFRGVSVYPRGGYRTPLGIVPIAEDLTSRLMETSPVISYVPQAHAQEHSLEIQLPFLQVVLKDFRLVPLVMGEHDFHTCQELA
ncbi:MAG: AmmeMemoRadiSam system protein B, partial [Deltaproteobacteria bacterium]